METAEAQDGEALTAHEGAVAYGAETALGRGADIQKIHAEGEGAAADGLQRIGESDGAQGGAVRKGAVADGYHGAALGVGGGDEQGSGLGAHVARDGAGVLGQGLVGKEAGVLGHIEFAGNDAVGLSHDLPSFRAGRADSRSLVSPSAFPTALLVSRRRLAAIGSLLLVSPLYHTKCVYCNNNL